MSFQHQSLANGKWFELSLCSQMGNIGSEIGRAKKWKDKDAKLFESAIFRAIELLDLTFIIHHSSFVDRCSLFFLFEIEYLITINE